MNSTQNQILNSAAVSASFAPRAARKGWFSRNWKWLGSMVLAVGFGLALALIVLAFAAMKNSDVAKESVLQAQANPLVVQKLGTPITEGWMVSGSVNTSTTSGDADLAVPISGPKGQAKIYVTAQKVSGAWNYSVMEVAIAGNNERINLLSNEPAKGEFPASPVSPAEPAAQPTGQPASAPASGSGTSAPPVAEQAGVIQTQETNQGDVAAEMTECRRSEGVLNIKIRFHNTSNKPTNLDLLPSGGGDYAKYYVTAANKKYFILKDSEGTFLATPATKYGLGGTIEPGHSFLFWAKYPAPPADIKKINYITPVTPPFDDVPITDK
jgi:Cytochrome oxidase complex assembly protein 1